MFVNKKFVPDFLVFLLLFALGLSCSFAQKPFHLKYFDKNDIEISSVDNAWYVRHYFLESTVKTVSNTDQISILDDANYFSIKEIYTNGKLKTVGALWFKNASEYLDSTFVRYDESGKIKSIVNYKRGVKLGAEFAFYPNRKVKYEVENKASSFHQRGLYVTSQKGVDFNSMMSKGHVISYVDSNGVELVKDGNGYMKRAINLFGEEVAEEGSYVNGLKEGEWVVRVLNSDKIYKEKYKNGILKKGVVIEGGKKTTYVRLVEPPKFPDYLSRSGSVKLGPQRIQMPNNIISFQDYLREMGFEYILSGGKDIQFEKIYFKLTVDKNGSFKNLSPISLVPNKVVVALTHELKKIKRFTPGFYRGKAIDMDYPDFYLLLTNY